MAELRRSEVSALRWADCPPRGQTHGLPPVEVGGEGRVLEPAAVRAKRRAGGARPGVRPAGVQGRARPQRGGGLEAAHRRAVRDGGAGRRAGGDGGGPLEGELVRPAPTTSFITADPNHRGRRTVRPRKSCSGRAARPGCVTPLQRRCPSRSCAGLTTPGHGWRAGPGDRGRRTCPQGPWQTRRPPPAAALVSAATLERPTPTARRLDARLDGSGRSRMRPSPATSPSSTTKGRRFEQRLDGRRRGLLPGPPRP